MPDKKPAYGQKDVFTDTPAGKMREAGAKTLKDAYSGFSNWLSGGKKKPPASQPSSTPEYDTIAEPINKAGAAAKKRLIEQSAGKK